jgi:hypothetical protein
MRRWRSEMESLPPKIDSMTSEMEFRPSKIDSVTSEMEFRPSKVDSATSKNSWVNGVIHLPSLRIR